MEMEETQLTNGFETLKTPRKEEEIEPETEQGGNSHHLRVSGSWCTRSQVAPDWTMQESIILVNEISAVEGDCLNTLSSFQKWKIIVENCNALEVNRSLNQCRRKWDSLLAEYKRIKQWESEARAGSYWTLDGDMREEFGFPQNMSTELFKAIDYHVKVQEGRTDTDPDSDREAEANGLRHIVESGLKKQRRRVTPQKRNIEGKLKPQKRNIEGKLKPQKRSMCEKIKQCSFEEEVEPLKHSIGEKLMPKKRSVEEKEQMMAAKVRENAELIKAILEENQTENEDYRSADLKNIEAFQTDFTRRQGDQLIACLGCVAETLEQLCSLVQEECG